MTDRNSSSSLSEPSRSTSSNGRVSSIVFAILQDARKLAEQQVEMLKAEVKEDFRRSKRAAELGGLGIVMLTVGFLGLITALAYLLHEYYDFSLWLSWGITGATFFLIGSILAVTAYVLVERFNPLPDKTFNALQENLTWKRRG